MTAKCAKLKWNHEPRASHWFHCKVLNILTSFLWPLKTTDHENCCRFVFFFTITLTVWMSISIEVSRKIAREGKRKTYCAIITSSFPWPVLLSNIALDQSAHGKPLSYCNCTSEVKYQSLYKKGFAGDQGSYVNDHSRKNMYTIKTSCLLFV